MSLMTVLAAGLAMSFVGCKGEAPPPVTCAAPTQLVNGQCIFPCNPGERLNEASGVCEVFLQCGDYDCSAGGGNLPPNAANGTAILDVQQGNCQCLPNACAQGYVLQGGVCVGEIQCPAGFIQELQGNGATACVPDETISCYDAPTSPYCIPTLCSEQPTAADGTDLLTAGKCINDANPVAVESCTNNCHNGIENPHPWFGGPDLTCTGCHAGNPEATTRQQAHIPIPQEWQVGSDQFGRPNLRYYWNYNTLWGVENFEGGLEWLRFINPGDLRVADQSCGKSSGCHQDRVENTKRSVMATEVGLVGTSQHQNGIARAVNRGDLGVYKWDTTYGMTQGGPLEALAYNSNYTGSVQRLNQFTVQNRDFNGAYNQIDLLREAYDKQCGDCHLGNRGANNRYADFRSSGCAACHMPYALDGRSRSTDPMINKDEPYYPVAYNQISNFNANDLANFNGAFLGPQRAHPIRHVLTRQMASQRCGACHVGSNRTDWQFRGYQIDPNRTAVTALNNNFIAANQVQFTDEIDNNANPFARYHGQAQDQVLAFIDWNNDGRNDIPADIHYQAGFECMDCHTTGEMHNELRFVKVAKVTDWADPNQVDDMSGAIWSHQDQSTEVECVSCHGNLEYRALSYAVDNRNPVKNLLVCPEANEVIADYEVPAECAQLGAGRWTRSKFADKWHYTPQVYDTVRETIGGGGASNPSRGNAPIYTANASLFHGRYNNTLLDGAGPCQNIAEAQAQACFQDQANAQFPVTQGFSHLGDAAKSAQDQMQGGLECYACHSTWANMCVGCHLATRDFDGNTIRRDFMRSTGEYTLGEVFQADFTYIGNEDMQYMVNSEGKISQAYTNGDVYRHIDYQGNEFFGTQVIVNNDANLIYNMYRHVSGYGTRQYNTEQVGLPPNSDGLVFDQFAQMDNNAGQGFSQMMPHTTQRSRIEMDCAQNCHINTNADNTNEVLATYAANANGFGNVSDYLAVLANTGIVRNNTNDTVVVDAAAGYRFDANIDPVGFVVNSQMDWKVFYDANNGADNGFPLSYSNHPMKTAYGLTLDPAYINAYPTMANVSGGINSALMLKLFNRVLVDDVGVQDRGVR
jgi:hypothetical protein